MLRIHILGICGTFMGGLALIARQLGMEVTGSDANVYPPMSTQLESHGIVLSQGYNVQDLKGNQADLVVIGNAMSRGNPVVEYILERGIAYTSGPEFLSRYVLQDRWVLAVAGTHGKTTTSSMLAWILEYAGLNPGFLIGGVPNNFDASARLGEMPFFVVEADEYDTAFFDKRSKFVHYKPRTLILNNLEYDHADIFPDLASIQRQFHHLLRIVPSNGLVIKPADDKNIETVLEQGCWTPVEQFTDTGPRDNRSTWLAKNMSDNGQQFDVYFENQFIARLDWDLMGQHNVQNALAAIAAARHAGVMPEHAVDALSGFQGVKRRMEELGNIDGIRIYDDFAHHPTAIASTIQGLRKQVGDSRIIAVVEPRSNTMRMGVHKDSLSVSLAGADLVFLFKPSDISWSLQDVVDDMASPSFLYDDVDQMVEQIVRNVRSGDHVLIMSNGAFGGLHRKLIEALK
ncbi:MAG: UDP-N-acetylmuramate:L-alanyl-gamma-D-glutamyl-meso-diaminopimelate ligase [Gammaproteobacteria bacterium]